MPSYTNHFASPEYMQEKIVREADATVVGTIRVKPSAILWKEGRADFYNVNLTRFIAWIKDPTTKAKRTKS
jgi:hypothetical protein